MEIDPLGRAQLIRNGLDPGRLRTPGAAGSRPDFLLGPLREAADLPLIARFGTGTAVLGLRLVVPDGAAYSRALAEDEAARRLFGSALAENGNLILGAGAASALRAGSVDSRLMVGLAGAASSLRLGIAQFADTSEDPATGAILREVTIANVSDLTSADTNQSAVGRLATFLRMQESPYQPLAVFEAGSSVSVRYAAPSPLGLLSP